MVETMHQIVFRSIKATKKKTKYIVISCDKFITIDNQLWRNVHVYVIDGFNKVSLLLNLKKVVDGGPSNNLTLLILGSLEKYGGFSVE